MIAGARVEVAPYKQVGAGLRHVEAIDAGAPRLGLAMGPGPAGLAH